MYIIKINKHTGIHMDTFGLPTYHTVATHVKFVRYHN